jgi:hypothetical protein
MSSINQCFGKHCSCHLQGECVVRRVLEALYRAGPGGELHLMVLISRAEESAAPQLDAALPLDSGPLLQSAPSNLTRHLLPALYKASRTRLTAHTSSNNP